MLGMRFLLLGLVLTFVAPVPAPAADTARGTIEELAAQVLAILRNGSLPTDEKRRRLEDIVDRHTDFETLSRLVLARNWSRFSPEQQREFMEEFKEHLSITYRDSVERYTDQDIRITGERQEARGDVTVRSEIVRASGAEPIAVDYRLRRIDGQWKVIDIIVEHVSLVANYRSQFQDMMSGGKPEALLAALKEKNARGEPLKAPGKGASAT